MAIALAGVPQDAHAAAFGVQKLRQGSAAGAENYLFTDGDLVFAQGTVDAGTFYRFSVLDAGGSVRSSSSCIQTLFKKSATYKYALQPTDPAPFESGSASSAELARDFEQIWADLRAPEPCWYAAAGLR